MGASFANDSLPTLFAQVGPTVQVAQGPVRGPSFYSRLYVPVTLQVGDGVSLHVSALVDTGCESNLVRQGVIPPHHFHPAARPITFMAANKIQVVGGSQEVCCQLICDGVDLDTGLAKPLQFSFVCLEADIGGGDLVIFPTGGSHRTTLTSSPTSMGS